MKAIIIAAGRGVRMGSRGQLTPKGLMRLGEKSMVEDSILTLADHGIRDICLVTGHLFDQYHALVETLPVPVEVRHNPDYATTGSLPSLLIGLKGHAGACVILESDLTYEPRALDALDPVQSRLIVSGTTGAGDEVYVWTRQNAAENHLVQLSKDIAAEPSPHFGELVGITGLTDKAVSAFRAVGTGLAAVNPMTEYETALVAMSRDLPVNCVKLDGLAWAEADDENMLKHAQRDVYPRVLAARKLRAATSAKA